MFLYIDPGTGSMLFTILIGILGTAVYLLRNVFVKLRFLFSGGAKVKQDEDRVPFAIFTDSKRYWNVFGPICEELEKRGVPIEYFTASEDDPALSMEFEHVKCSFAGEGNRAFAKMNFIKADVLLSSTPGLDVYQWKRSKDVKWYVHVPHAASDICMYRMFGLDYYDAVFVSGEYQRGQIRKLEELRGLPAKELPMAGVTYLDTMKARLEKEGPAEDHPVTVLLAPSWGKTAIFSLYGGKIIDALLKTGYHVIVRPHPQSFTSEKEMIEGLMAQYPESSQLEWNRDNDNFEVLRRSDVMISDFSGVIFDYSLVFGKPVIYTDTTYDKSPYDACWLDEELWTFRVLPKIGRKLDEEGLANIKELVDSVMYGETYRTGIDEARDETWENRGQAAKLIADYMIAKREELLAQAAEEARTPKKSVK